MKYQDGDAIKGDPTDYLTWFSNKINNIQGPSYWK